MTVALPSGRLIARIAVVVLAFVALVFVARTGLAFALAPSNPELAQKIDGKNAAALTALGASRMLTARNDADVAAVDRISRDALLRSPLQAVALRNVGFVMIANGRDADAARALTLAGDATLRDYLTHAWLLDRNFRENRVAASIDEADIVLRQNAASWPVIMPALGGLLADSRTIAPLARALARRPHWRGTFLASLGSAPVDKDGAYALLTRMTATGTAASTAELDNYFVSIDAVPPATLWARWLALTPARPSSGALLRDGGFDGLDAPGPFNWTFFARDSVYAEISDAPENKGRALYLSYDGSGSANFASQRLILRPGRYRLQGAAFADGAVAPGQIEAIVRCGPGEGPAEIGRLPLAPATDRWSRFAFEFDISGVLIGNPAETLDPSTVWIDDLTLRPVG